MMLDGTYAIENMSLPVWFYGIERDGEIAGVNSIHLCQDGSARSRGLWVDPKWRGYGFGQQLLKHAIAIARENQATSIWSYPRRSSWTTYYQCGFNLITDWNESETSDANAYCLIKF